MVYRSGAVRAHDQIPTGRFGEAARPFSATGVAGFDKASVKARKPEGLIRTGFVCITSSTPAMDDLIRPRPGFLTGL
jgi:hypothetical protein